MSTTENMIGPDRARKVLTGRYSVDFGESQARRRDKALQIQRGRRQQSLESVRGSLLIDVESDDGLVSAPSSGSKAAVESPPMADRDTAPSVTPRYLTWAQDLLMYAEPLDLSGGLPHDLESEWGAVIIPSGKRCLVFSKSNTTVLTSRVTGRVIKRAATDLPKDTMLDCVFDEEKNVLWCIDIIKWKGAFLVNCDYDKRSRELTKHISELWDYPNNLSLLLPPRWGSPLTHTLFRNEILPKCGNEKALALLLYVSKGHYVAGQTTLAAWVSVKEIAYFDAFCQLFDNDMAVDV